MKRLGDNLLSQPQKVPGGGWGSAPHHRGPAALVRNASAFAMDQAAVRQPGQHPAEVGLGHPR